MKDTLQKLWDKFESQQREGEWLSDWDTRDKLDDLTGRDDEDREDFIGYVIESQAARIAELEALLSKKSECDSLCQRGMGASGSPCRHGKTRW